MGGQYLSEHGEAFTLETLHVQAVALLQNVFYALSVPPSSLAQKSGNCRLVRLGLDLLVDSSYHLWLIEVNLLKDGYGLGYAVKGPLGDSKRALIQELLIAEGRLRAFLRGEAS